MRQASGKGAVAKDLANHSFGEPEAVRHKRRNGFSPFRGDVVVQCECLFEPNVVVEARVWHFVTRTRTT